MIDKLITCLTEFVHRYPILAFADIILVAVLSAYVILV